MKRFLFPFFLFFFLFLIPSFSTHAKDNYTKTYNSMISEPPVSDQSGYVLVVDNNGKLHTIVWSWSYHPQSNAGYGPSDFGGFENYYPILPNPSIRISASRGWNKLQIQCSTGYVAGQNNNWGQRIYWSFTDYMLNSNGYPDVYYYNTFINDDSTTLTFDFKFRDSSDTVSAAQGYGSAYYSLPSSWERFNVCWADEQRQQEYLDEIVQKYTSKLQSTIISEIFGLSNAVLTSSEKERELLQEQINELVELQGVLIDFKNQAHSDCLDVLSELRGIHDGVDDIISILQEVGDSSKVSDLPDKDINDLESAEDNLLNKDTSDYETSISDGFKGINSESNKGAMSFWWNVVQEILNLNSKVFNIFLVLLVLGFISLVLGR